MNRQTNRSENTLGVFGRSAARIIVALTAVVVLLGFSGFAYQSVSEARDDRQYQTRGELIDVGGYRLHLYCTGQGNPAIQPDLLNDLDGTGFDERE